MFQVHEVVGSLFQGMPEKANLWPRSRRCCASFIEKTIRLNAIPALYCPFIIIDVSNVIDRTINYNIIDTVSEIFSRIKILISLITPEQVNDAHVFSAIERRKKSGPQQGIGREGMQAAERPVRTPTQSLPAKLMVLSQRF